MIHGTNFSPSAIDQFDSAFPMSIDRGGIRRHGKGLQRRHTRNPFTWRRTWLPLPQIYRFLIEGISRSRYPDEGQSPFAAECSAALSFMLIGFTCRLPLKTAWSAFLEDLNI